MKLGRIFGRLLQPRKVKEPEAARDTHYEYPVSSGDNIRFHPERVPASDVLRKELTKTFPNLEEVVFTNLRLEHANANDARAAVAEITKRNPHFILEESMDAPHYAQEYFNDFVQGTSNGLGNLLPGEFARSMLVQLRKLKEGGFPIPLIIIADVPKGSPLLSPLGQIYRMPDILTGRWETLADAKKQVLSRVVQFVESTLQREKMIVENVPRRIAEAVRADSEKYKTLDVDAVHRLDLLAPYGSSHGTLSGLFRDQGAKTAAINQSYSLHPIDTMIARVKMCVKEKGDLESKEIDDAVTDGIFSALIESGIPRWKRDLSEYFGKPTQRQYLLALRNTLKKWRMDAKEGRGPSLEELRAEALRDSSNFFEHRAVPEIRSFLNLEKKSTPTGDVTKTAR